MAARYLRSILTCLRLTALFAGGAMELLIKRPKTRIERAEWLHWFCLRVVGAIDVKMRLEGRFPRHGVLISNHLGYLDIMVFAALHRCVFVSKAELLDIPVLGWMTTMAGTVYVERGKGGSTARAREGMLGAAESGTPVVFFPEGTTSDGSGVLPFRSGLLSLAVEAGQPVTPAFIRYSLRKPNGRGVTVANDLCYWGDVSMVSHIFKLAGLRGVEVDVLIAEAPIAFSDAAADRKVAAIEARTAVMKLGGVAAGAQKN